MALEPSPKLCSKTRPPTHQRLVVYDLHELKEIGCIVVDKKIYNARGYHMCGVLNQHDKPCSRIGRCPFHRDAPPVTDENSCNGVLRDDGPENQGQCQPAVHAGLDLPQNPHFSLRVNAAHKLHSDLTGPDYAQPITRGGPCKRRREDTPTEGALMHGRRSGSRPVLPQSSCKDESRSVGPKRRKIVGKSAPESAAGKSSFSVQTRQLPAKQPFKKCWKREEHYLFLIGLNKFGKGNWKKISTLVGTRNPTQIQSHAQKYFLRRKQPNKNKKSIHDLNLDSQQMREVAEIYHASQSKQQLLTRDGTGAIPSHQGLEPVSSSGINSHAVHSQLQHVHGHHQAFQIIGSGHAYPAQHSGSPSGVQGMASEAYTAEVSAKQISNAGLGSVYRHEDCQLYHHHLAPPSQSQNPNPGPPLPILGSGLPCIIDGEHASNGGATGDGNAGLGPECSVGGAAYTMTSGCHSTPPRYPQDTAHCSSPPKVLTVLDHDPMGDRAPPTHDPSPGSTHGFGQTHNACIQQPNFQNSQQEQSRQQPLHGSLYQSHGDGSGIAPGICPGTPPPRSISSMKALTTERPSFGFDPSPSRPPLMPNEIGGTHGGVAGSLQSDLASGQTYGCFKSITVIGTGTGSSFITINPAASESPRTKIEGSSSRAGGLFSSLQYTDPTHTTGISRLFEPVQQASCKVGVCHGQPSYHQTIPQEQKGLQPYHHQDQQLHHCQSGVALKSTSHAGGENIHTLHSVPLHPLGQHQSGLQTFPTASGLTGPLNMSQSDGRHWPGSAVVSIDDSPLLAAGLLSSTGIYPPLSNLSGGGRFQGEYEVGASGEHMGAALKEPGPGPRSGVLRSGTFASPMSEQQARHMHL